MSIVGLFDPDDEGGDMNTGRFVFVDGVDGDLDFYATAGIDPWNPDRPNDLGGNENCVRWQIEQNLWNDVVCAQELRIFCRRPNILEQNSRFKSAMAILMYVVVAVAGVLGLAFVLIRREYWLVGRHKKKQEKLESKCESRLQQYIAEKKAAKDEPSDRETAYNYSL